MSAIDTFPRLRALADKGAAQFVVQTARAASVLDRAPRVIAGQITGREQRHALRHGGTVTVRHRTRDIAILNEIFAAGTYAPPNGLSLAGPITVTDLGGNIGLFGAYARQQWNVARMVSVEPDPDNLRLLRATATGNWEVIPAAASTAEGTMRFRAGRLSESREAQAGEEFVTVQRIDVFDLPACDLMKIDIEGGEWPILTDSRLGGLPARAVVMEWHALGCPDGDPSRFAERLLDAAGFGNVAHRPGRWASNGTLWAWR